MKTLMHSCVLVLLLSAFEAAANLQVFPTRVMLSDSQRTGQISVRHKGTKRMSYRIEAVYYKMHPDGQMELIKDAETADKSATSMFRFSPRQVMLEPDIEQVVRVLLRPKADTPDGDYRAHLYFEGVDEEGPKDEAETAKSEKSKMNLKARMAIAVPIVVRKGNPDLAVSLENLKTVMGPDGKLSFAVDLKRTGKSFMYADFVATFIPEGKTDGTVVGQANGVSSYIDKRVVSYPLTVTKLDKGTLKLEVRKPELEGSEVLASTTMEIK